MSKPFQGSLMEQVVKLRKMGLTNAQVCLRLGCKPNTAKVSWCRYQHRQKYKEYYSDYYQRNKKERDNYNKAWCKKNPDLVIEYRFRNKCNKAGVDWRMAG